MVMTGGTCGNYDDDYLGSGHWALAAAARRLRTNTGSCSDISACMAPGPTGNPRCCREASGPKLCQAEEHSVWREDALPGETGREPSAGQPAPTREVRGGGAAENLTEAGRTRKIASVATREPSQFSREQEPPRISKNHPGKAKCARTHSDSNPASAALPWDDAGSSGGTGTLDLGSRRWGLGW